MPLRNQASEIIVNLQRLLIFIFTLSLITLGGIIYFTDPFVGTWYFTAFLVNIFVFFTTFFAIIGFWLAFNRRYLDLSNVRVMSVIKQSAVGSSLITLILFLSAVRQLNILNLSILIFAFLLYELWSS